MPDLNRPQLCPNCGTMADETPDHTEDDRTMWFRCSFCGHRWRVELREFPFNSSPKPR
jgi:hypothetical protein